jgi:autotransporter-associated beta strand protein
MRSRFAHPVTVLVGLAVLLVARHAALAQTWDGGGANNNWTNGLNWVGDVAPVNNGTADIIMAGTVDPTPVVDSAQSIDSLTFNNTAGAFTISGQPLTIAGGITNNDTQTQTINSNIVVNAGQVWNATSGNLAIAGNISPSVSVGVGIGGANNTTLSGVISGALSLVKSDAGTLTLSGASANTYTGTTEIQDGTLALNKTAGVNAIAGGTVTVGEIIGSATLRLDAANQIANTVDLEIGQVGHFNLNGFNETIDTLTFFGGSVSTGAGTLTLGGNVTVGAGTTSSISGILGLSGQRTFTVGDGPGAIDLDIPATITGGGIIKTGAGTLRLGAANTLPSNVRIDAGTVDLDNGGAFGAGTVQFNGGVITSDVVNQVVTNNLVIAGNVGFGTTASPITNTVFSGNITLSGGDRTITVESSLGAGISGPIGQDLAGRSLIKDGSGTLIFLGSSANTYSGTTTINAGTLSLQKSGAGNGAIIGNLIIGDGTGTDTAAINRSEQINNSSTVTINSFGQLNVSAVGGLTETISSLVMSGGTASIGNGAVLVVTGGYTINANAASATIAATTTTGALSLNGSNKTFTIPDGAATFDLDISAVVSNGAITKDGPGTMRLRGSSSNNYSGTTTVNAGMLVLNKTSANAVSGQLVIGDGIGGVNSDIVRFDSDHQFNINVSPLINESGLLNLNNRDQDLFGGITLTGGAVTTGTGSLDVGAPIISNASAQTATISGNLGTILVGGNVTFDVANGAAPIDLDVSATIPASLNGGVVKNGAGTLKLSGASTYTGATQLNAGIVEVSADANLGAAASGITLNGGTLRTSASFSTSRIISLQSVGGSIETLAITTINNPISGSASLTKSGAGTLIMNSQNSLIDNLTVSAGTFQLASAATFDIADDLDVNAAATVVLQNTANFSASNVFNSGNIAFDGTSATLQSNTLTNSGLVRGRGRIDAPLNNQVAGEVRAATGDLLQFINASASTNGGRINLLGGAVEFTQSSLTNSAAGQIVGHGTLDANSIANSGTMAFSGAANVLGNVTNNSGAKIISSGGGPATFFDDVVNIGEIRTSAGGFSVFFGSVTGTGSFTGTGTVNIEGDLSPGSSPAAVNFAGNLTLGPLSSLAIEIGGLTPGSLHDKLIVAGLLDLDGTLAVSLTNGFNPAAGNSFDILDWGTLSGTFSAINLPALAAGLVWNTSQLYTAGVLSVASVGVPGDYNNNGTVDAADYVLWRSGGPLANEVDNPGSVNAGDYTAWRARFGNSGNGAGIGSGATGSASAQATTVPEPLAIQLLIMVSSCLLLQRACC